MYRTGSRGFPAQAGYSVLAALVFVGILGSIAAAVNILTPSGNPIASSASVAAVNPGGQGQQQQQPKPEGQQKQCVQGYDYKIYRTNNEPIIETVPVCPGGNAAPQAVQTGAAVLALGTYGLTNDSARCQQVNGKWQPKSEYESKIKYCVGKGKYEKCEELKDSCKKDAGIDSKKIDGNLRNGLIQQALKETPVNEHVELLKNIGYSPKDDAQLIKDAYKDQQLDTNNEIAKLTNRNTGIDQELQQLAGACKTEGDAACKRTQDLQYERLDNERKAQELNQRLEALKAAEQKALTPPPPPCTGPNCAQVPPPTCTTNCPPQPPPSTFPPPSNPSGPGGQGGNPLSMLQSLLGRLLQPQAPQCSADPNQYQQQQQQYQQQLQQYNYQLMQYNYMQQQAAYSGTSAPPPPAPPQQCTPNSQQNTCGPAPAQPTSGCTNGSWVPVKTNQNNGVQCTTGWQCGSATSTQPTAQLSCQPKVVDAGMSVALSFSCGNSTGSTGSGPNFNTENKTSGSTTALVETPPAGATGITYALTCRNESLSARAECAVEIAKPAIVFAVNPNPVPSGQSARVGWVTSGMQSCVISSPQMPAFTTQNASSTVVNGSATTSPITTETTVVLTCQTIGGVAKAASTTISVATSTASN